MSELLHHLLERNARKYPNDLATICHVTNTSLTWSEQNRMANRLAHLLVKKGLNKNDHVAILFSNQIEYVISFFAIFKAGGTVVPINSKLTKYEVNQIVSTMDVKLVIYHPSLKETLNDLEVEGLSFSISDIETILNEREDDLDLGVDVEDTAEILLTSGTTGRPKGVMLSHRAVYQSAMMMSIEMSIQLRDRVLQLMPLTHSAPLNLTYFGSVFAGAVSIIDNFTPDKLLEHTQNDKITHFFGAPVAYLLALKILQTKEYNLTSMKKWIYGGAPMPSTYLHVLRNKFPGEFVGVYGLTEAGPNGLALYSDEHEQHIGTIGRRATVNTEFRVVDQFGKDVNGAEGEVILKTSSMMTGYYKNPEATQEAIVNGWIYTGDIGKIDEHGYLHLIDRKKDVIISGGTNIYPSEIETAIYQISGVQDVAVISIPNDEWGETPVAIVVKGQEAELSAEYIKNSLRDKLAKYKIPREVIFANELPRNGSGKILKYQLREIYR